MICFHRSEDVNSNVPTCACNNNEELQFTNSFYATNGGLFQEFVGAKEPICVQSEYKQVHVQSLYEYNDEMIFLMTSFKDLHPLLLYFCATETIGSSCVEDGDCPQGGGVTCINRVCACTNSSLVPDYLGNSCDLRMCIA